jgi:subtilisin family serine protease
MNRYEVVKKAEVSKEAFLNELRGYGVLVRDLSALKNHFRIDTDLDLEEVISMPCVKTASRSDSIVRGARSVTHDGDFFASTNGNWGLARTLLRTNPWQRLGKMFKAPEWPKTVTLPAESRNGRDVDVYVVDSGFNYPQDELPGRVTIVSNEISGKDNADDEFGHGTPIASMIAGINFGVAPRVSIRVVRVLDEQNLGSANDIINGLDTVLSQFNMRNRYAIVNLSISSTSTALKEAAEELANSGIVVCSSAGNDDVNLDVDLQANEVALAFGTITCGALTYRDTRADFTNYGSVIDIFGPGKNCVGSDLGNTTDTFSGTSFAAPHVCGVAARLAEGRLKPFGYSGAADVIGEVLLNASTKKMRKWRSDTTDRIVYADENLPAVTEADPFVVGAGKDVAGTTDVTSIDLDFDADTQANDLVLAFITHRDTLTVPSGWSLVVSQQCSTVNTSITQYMSVYSKTYQSGDGSSVTWIQASSERMQGVVVTIRGSSTPVVKSNATGQYDASSTDPGLHPVQPVTATADNQIAFSASSCVFANTLGATTYTVPSMENSVLRDIQEDLRTSVSWHQLANGESTSGNHSHGNSSTHDGAEVSVLVGLP